MSDLEIKIFLLSNNAKNKNLSMEYLSSISGITKKIKSEYEINIKAIPVDAEGLKKLQLNKNNKIKIFPSATYAGSIYSGKKIINNLLSEIVESINIRKSKYQDELNKQKTQINYEDIMGSYTGDDQVEDTEAWQKKMARFDKKRNNINLSSACGDNSNINSHGDIVDPNMFSGGDRDVACFNALLQDETPDLRF